MEISNYMGIIYLWKKKNMKQIARATEMQELFWKVLSLLFYFIPSKLS